MKPEFDVTILGAGMAGLSLARQLLAARPATRILLLDKRQHPAPQAAFKVGESTVEIGAHYLNDVLKLTTHLKTDQLPKYGLRFFFGAQTSPNLSDAYELGPSKLFTLGSYQTDRGRLENHLVDDLIAAGAEFKFQTRVGKIDLGEDGAAHHIPFTHAGAKGQISSRWVVDARGRAAGLKRQLDLNLEHDHHINSVWWRISDPIRIDDWCQWRTPSEGINANRWLSTIHLMGEGYWIWIIPLASGCTSIGIVADPQFHPISHINRYERALDWLSKHQPHLAAQLTSRRDKLMDFKVLKNFSYDCRQVFSAQRWALTGEAGAFPDPFYSPGTDFIGVSNSFLTALITRDLKGRSIDALASVYDQIYLTLFHSTMHTYRHQYALFGNPGVMTLKIMWDYAVYWSFSAFVFIQGRLTHPASWSHLRPMLNDLPQLNLRTQIFFRDLHQAWNQPHQGHRFVDQFGIDLLQRLNDGLTQPMDDNQFRERGLENLTNLKALQAEIFNWAADRFPQLEEWRQTEQAPGRFLTKVLAGFS